VTKRVCGSCTLCCRLLPVAEIRKKANTRCSHQFSGGCRVYHKANFPLSCGFWSCRWLTGDASGVRRPDRTHYVIDIMLDTVVLTHNETGERFEEKALQVWIDPEHRDAWKDPALLAYIDGKRMPALLRYSSWEADGLFPPSRSSNGRWNHVTSIVKK